MLLPGASSSRAWALSCESSVDLTSLVRTDCFARVSVRHSVVALTRRSAALHGEASARRRTRQQQRSPHRRARVRLELCPATARPFSVREEASARREQSVLKPTHLVSTFDNAAVGVPGSRDLAQRGCHRRHLRGGFFLHQFRLHRLMNDSFFCFCSGAGLAKD